jgi:hypothetical protein
MQAKATPGNTWQHRTIMSSSRQPTTSTVDRYGVPIEFNNNSNRQDHHENANANDENENGDDNTTSSTDLRRGSATGRRGSTGATTMTEEEQKGRRASIKAIMKNLNLNPSERRLSIQALMDGRRDRRRSSCGGGTAGTGAGCGSPGTGTAAGAGAATSTSPTSSTANDNDNRNRNDNVDLGQAHSLGNIHPGMHANLMSRVDFSTMTEAQKEQAKAVQIAISTRMDQNRPPCNHYNRNCTIISPCCGMAFGCRICHDECPQLPPPLLNEQPKMNMLGEHHSQAQPSSNRYQRASSMPTSNQVQVLPDSDNQHPIERFKIAEIICRQCFTRQSSKT